MHLHESWRCLPVTRSIQWQISSDRGNLTWQCFSKFKDTWEIWLYHSRSRESDWGMKINLEFVHAPHQLLAILGEKDTTLNRMFLLHLIMICTKRVQEQDCKIILSVYWCCVLCVRHYPIGLKVLISFESVFISVKNHKFEGEEHITGDIRIHWKQHNDPGREVWCCSQQATLQTIDGRASCTATKKLQYNAHCVLQ